MTVEQLLDQASDLIVVAQHAPLGVYRLYARNGRLELCKISVVDLTVESIHIFNSADVNTDLSSLVWNRIDAKIRTLHKKGLLK